MADYHKFDETKVAAVLDAVRGHQGDMATARAINAADGHLSLATECLSVKVEDDKICLDLPLGIGKVCIPIPGFIPNGTVAEACLKICTFGPIPTGAKVAISVAGKTIAEKTFGKC